MQKIIQFTATDGFPLEGRVFTSSQESDKVLLINPAVAVPQGYYAPFADYMSKQGYAVYTYDYRGIGASRKQKSLKGFEANMQDWAKKDLSGVLSFIQKNHSSSSLSVLGHSFGGNCLGMNEEAIRSFEKVVMIGSQFGYYGYFWASKKPLLFAFWNIIIPSLCRLYGYFPSELIGMGEQLPKGVALEWAKMCRNPQWLFSYLPENDNFYSKLKQNTLAISIEDDWYAPKKAVDKLFELGYTETKLKRLHLIPEELGLKSLGHFGFFKEKNKEKLWQIIPDFLNN